MPPLRRDISITPIDRGGPESPDVLEISAREYDYLSLINEETYGIPPLVTKTKDRGEDRPAVAGPDDTVLYVNTGAVLTMRLGPVVEED